MKTYLSANEFIDCEHPDIREQARLLSKGYVSDTDITLRCFEFVRDEINHTGDVGHGAITCLASDVLREGTGYCYAKSHLLVALLRANQIPAGLCYQRLTIEGDEPPFCLHGLTAVYLSAFGWFRIDPRGNKDGVNAQFQPPEEKLAFPIVIEGEADLPEIWAEPLPIVTSALKAGSDVDYVATHLPDIQLLCPSHLIYG